MPLVVQDPTNTKQFLCPKCKGPVARYGYSSADKPCYYCKPCNYQTTHPYLVLFCPKCGKKLSRAGKEYSRTRGSRRDPHRPRQKYECKHCYTRVTAGEIATSIRPQLADRCRKCGGRLKRAGKRDCGSRNYQCLSCGRQTVYQHIEGPLTVDSLAFEDNPPAPDIGCTYKGRCIPLCRECPLPHCQLDGFNWSWEFLELLPKVYELRQQGHSMGSVSRTLNIPMGTTRHWCVILEGEYAADWHEDFVEKIKAGYQAPEPEPEDLTLKPGPIWRRTEEWVKLNHIPDVCPRCGRRAGMDGFPDELYCWNCGPQILPWVKLPRGWVEPRFAQVPAYRPFPTGYRGIRWPAIAKGTDWKDSRNNDLFTPQLYRAKDLRAV